MAERPEDLNLPTSVVSRIIKEALPDGVNVSKDTRLAISKAASVFVLYATSCANNFAIQHKRKTIIGQDVLDAMQEMEFDRFIDPLNQSLVAFKKNQQGKKDASEKRRKAAGDAGQNGSGDVEMNGEDTEKDSNEDIIEEEEEEVDDEGITEVV